MSILYQLEYATINNYDEPVVAGHFDFKVLPLENERQKLLNYKVKPSLDIPHEIYTNHEGFDVIRVQIYQRFNEFHLLVKSTVEVDEFNVFDMLFRFAAEEQAYYQSDEFKLANYGYTVATESTTISDEYLAAFPEFNWSQQVFYFLEELNHSVHDYLAFDTEATQVDSKLADVLQMQKGVCQDYAHLFIAIARRRGLAARYVSGYLHQGKNFKGAGQLHAWIEAYVPYVGWVGFDPTNAILADYHYIKICHGVDYHDCAPIKGVLRTQGQSKTSHTVKVETQQ